MRILFAGTPQVAVPTLHTLVEGDHQIVGVVTRPDAPAGRGHRVVDSPVGNAAVALGLPVAKPASVAELASVAADLAPDVAVVVAYGMLLPESVLAIPTHGWINLHFSLLPRWRGASPVQRAIRAGDATSGVTTFRIVKALDAGPIYRQTVVEVGPRETSGELLTRLSILGAQAMVETLTAIAAGEEPRCQGDGDGSYAAKITAQDVAIDWSHPAAEIDHLVRSANPAPVAWTTWGRERFRVLAVTPLSENSLAAGVLRATKKSLIIGTGTTDLRLDTVQAQGKRPMAGADWARGVHLNSQEARLG